jgi:transcriptional regulator with XRE-family HTH domain
VITPTQIRAARALLGWTQKELAAQSGLSEMAIKNLERQQSDPRSSTLAAIVKAFDNAGVVFLQPGDMRGGGAGVRFK